MNGPCPICNKYRAERLLAFIRREMVELARLETEHEKHIEGCEIVNGSWYLGLWSSARVGKDVYQ